MFLDVLNPVLQPYAAALAAGLMVRFALRVLRPTVERDAAGRTAAHGLAGCAPRLARGLLAAASPRLPSDKQFFRAVTTRPFQIVSHTREVAEAAILNATSVPELRWMCAMAESLRTATEQALHVLGQATDTIGKALAGLHRSLQDMLNGAEDAVVGVESSPSPEGRPFSILQPWVDTAEQLQSALRSKPPWLAGDAVGAANRPRNWLEDYPRVAAALREVAQRLQWLSVNVEAQDTSEVSTTADTNAGMTSAQQLAELLETLADGGLLEFRPAEGEPLVPLWHEVVAQFPAERPEYVNTVKRCLAPGYEWFGQLIFPARVEAWYAPLANNQGQART